ncbi:hypothetical protein FACS189468_9010 [Spirochaetia bacterium]|nr:hypothetical protein FACS189468_9010 [Spirochaetia bacterium]
MDKDLKDLKDRALQPLRKAAREIYAELGPGLEKGRYLDALAEKLAAGRYHFERGAALPVLFPTGPGKGEPKVAMVPDFTFKRRKVLVRVIVTPWNITDAAGRQLWSRIRAVGFPLGIILNFGLDTPEYRHVVHQGNLERWSRLRELTRPAREARLEAGARKLSPAVP